MFTTDFKDQPYWWEQMPLTTMDDNPLPESVDVVIIGAGYTGLNAAIQTARAGRNTLVLDAENAGWGASTRNGGQVSTSVKPSYDELNKKHGPEVAYAILKEGFTSLQWTEDFIRSEDIDCDFKVAGRFHAAHNSSQYEKLGKAVDRNISGLETESYMVPRAEQHAELGTDGYFGGAMFPKHASLHPARYHRGLLNKVMDAGATTISHCPVTDLSREKEGFLVKTPKGIVKAKQVMIATNGYTGGLTPWHQRRVIPIGSYVIATEALAPEVMDRLMPKDRIVSDTRKVVYYYRPSPDRSRIVFGGRVSLGETNPRASGPMLHRSLTGIFPELADAKISHSWMGFVAFTFDTLMHVGEDDGLFYSMGYCGSGVGMASYLGMKVGQQMLDKKEGETAFNNIGFQTRPLYKGKPWFLSPSVMYYKMRDHINI